MVSNENVDLGCPKCRECSLAQLLTGNLGEAETQRPLFIEFPEH
jgi:hypothetical protein